MDEYPEYDFIPTNLIDWKRPWFALVRTVASLIILVFAIVMLCYSIVSFVNPTIESISKETGIYYVHVIDSPLEIFSSSDFSDDSEIVAKEHALSGYNDEIFSCCIAHVVLSIISILLLVFGIRKYPSKDNHISNIADYVQKYSYSGWKGRTTPILKFYVKDYHMGLLDVAHYNVFLKARYDKLDWRVKGQYLNAKIGDKSLVIDIYGKELK